MTEKDYGIHIYKMMDKEEPSLYDSVVEGVALFGGIVVGAVVRYGTSCYFSPLNRSVIKMILGESVSITAATVAMTATATGIKLVGRYMKPHIIK